MDFDPTLFNGDPLQDRALQKPVATTAIQGGMTNISEVLKDTPAAVQGEQERIGASLPKAETSDVVEAAAGQWWTTGMYRYVTRPTFEPDSTPPSEHLKQLDIQLNNDEMDFFLNGNGMADRQWRVESIKKDREQRSLMGNRPMLAASVGGLDPAMLVMGALTGGTGTAARVAGLGVAASRGVAAGTGLVASATAAGAVAGTRPMSTEEIATGVILETLAAPLMSFKGMKKTVRGGQIVDAPVHVPVDPDFPAAELQAIAKMPERAAAEAVVSSVEDVARVGSDVAEEAPFGAMASGEMGDILLTPSAKAPGKFQLTHFADGTPVQDELFDTMEEAIDAFEDAVDMDGASILEKSWKSDTLVGEAISNAPVTVLKTKATTDPMTGTIHTVEFSDGTTTTLQKLDSTESMGLPGWHSESGYLADTKKAALTILEEQKNTSKGTRDKVMFEDIGLRPEVPPKVPVVPKDLTPGVPHEPVAAYNAVVQVMDTEAKSWAQKVGGAIEWNIHRSMQKFNPTGAKIADILYDNNGNLKITSVESHVRAAHVELRSHMAKFDNLLRDAMAEDGYGMRKQIFSSKAAAVQNNLEREVHLEILRRDQFRRQGKTILHDGIPARVKNMTDALSSTAKKALEELKAAGVKGAEDIAAVPDWAPRQINSASVQEILLKIEKHGHTPIKAKAMLIETLAKSYADANPKLTWEVAHDIAGATINRALRKGEFEDAAFSMNQGMDSAAQIRDLLKEENLSPKRVQRILDVVVGKADEAGKASFLKHRMDMDYTTNLDLGDEVINVTDLFDHGVKDLFDRYIDKTAAEVGFARKGLYSASDINKLRAEGIQSLAGNQAAQQEFVNLFDNSVAYLRGNKVGQDVGSMLRNTAAVNRIISLGSVGYWQLTEYAKMMQQYGALKTIKYMISEMPGFKQMLDTVGTDASTGRRLKDILETASNDSLRLQPYVRRFADGYEMPANATLQARLQHSTQLVPYFNGMKYVHGHQARTMANLIIDCINQAARGDAKMVAKLEKYGITPEMMTSLRKDVEAYGLDVDKWSAKSWGDVRPAFMKMMDESVLHTRLGDTPAFALLNPVGKFICTYRGFMLTAHNKLLAGSLQRDGLAGVSLMLLYQYPLTAMAVQAQTSINSKKPLKEGELAKMAIGQMGGLGMISEVMGALTGTKKQLGSPGVIPLDRAFTFAGETGKAITGQGDASRMLQSTAAMVPFFSIFPPTKAMTGLAVQELKE